MGKSPKEKSSLFRDNGATKTKVAPSDDRALSKVADPDTAHRPLRRKTWVNSRAKTCKEKTRRLFFVLCVLNAILNIFLYFLDVVTDILLCITFYQYNYIEWFHWMIVFMVLPYAIAIIGITYYAKLEHRGLRRFTIMICSPVLPLLCDIFLPFYSVTQQCCPDELTNFMVQYEATRTLSETVLETIPQLGLQVYIYLHCQGNSQNCKGMEKTDTALIRSLVAGGICIVYRFVMVYLDMKHQGLTLKGYFKSLIQLGAGLPLRAITENSMTHLKLSHAHLLSAQVRSLSHAVKNNRSITKIDLCDNQIGDEGAIYLAEALPTCL